MRGLFFTDGCFTDGCLTDRLIAGWVFHDDGFFSYYEVDRCERFVSERPAQSLGQGAAPAADWVNWPDLPITITRSAASISIESEYRAVKYVGSAAGSEFSRQAMSPCREAEDLARTGPHFSRCRATPCFRGAFPPMISS